MATNPQPLDETASSMLLELVEINSELEPLQARKKELEKFLKALEPGKYTNGAFDVTVSPQKRFDKKLFADTFPAEQHPHFYKQPEPEVDPKTLPPAVKEQFSTEYDNRLTIK